jgi:hypothetical protein
MFWLKSAKPGVTPLIIRAPMRTAVALSPGIPSESAGMSAPPVQALLATFRGENALKTAGAGLIEFTL